MGTRRAMLEGRTGPATLTSTQVRELVGEPLPLGVKPLPTSGLPPLEAAPLSRAAVPQIDIRALRPKQGLGRGLKLYFRGVAVVLSLLKVEESEGALTLETWDAGAAEVLGRQVVQVLGGRRRGDLFVICPVTGGRVVKLYLRNGRWASADAQRLV